MDTFFQPKKISAKSSVILESTKLMRRITALVPLFYWLAVALPGLLMGILSFQDFTPPKALYSMAIGVLVPVLHFGGSMALLYQIARHTDGAEKADGYIRTLVKPVVFFWTVIWASAVLALKYHQLNDVILLTFAALGGLALSPGLVAWGREVRPIPVTIGYYSFTAGYLLLLSLLSIIAHI